MASPLPNGLQDRSTPSAGAVLLRRVAERIHRHPDWTAVLALFLISVILNSPSLVATYASVNPHDEASYISSGWELLRGQVRDPIWGPAVALLYAPAFLLFRGMPLGFFYAATFGRFILYLLIWLACLLLDREVRPTASRAPMGGVLFLCSPFAAALANSSDALFTVLSGVSLAYVIKAARLNTPAHLGLASLFLGVAALVRPDGLVQILLLVPIAAWVGWRGRRLAVFIASSVLPALAVMGAFLLWRSIPLARLAADLQVRTYQAFEQGEWIVTGGDWGDASGVARSVYGDPAENGFSVFRAAWRHPEPFRARLELIVVGLPGTFLEAYGKRLGAAVFALAAIGFWILLKRRSVDAMVILGLWPASLLPYFLTFFREGYLMHAAPIVFALTAAGVAWIVGEGQSVRERWILALLLAATALAASLADKPAVVVGSLVLGIAVLMTWLARWIKPEGSTAGYALLVLLSAGLILRPGFSFPGFPTLGAAPQEKAIAYMQATLPERSKVVTYVPLPALAALATPVQPVTVHDVTELQAWLKAEDVRAIYSDSALRQRAPQTWAVMERAVGEFLDRGFLADPGSIEVLLVHLGP